MTVLSSPAIARLHALAPEPLPFAPRYHARAFLLERERGNLLVYSTTGIDPAELGAHGGAARWYLNHWHEATFLPDELDVPLFVHAGDAAEVEKRRHVRATFTRRHTLDDDFEVIPIPGHTPGATAFLWDTGEHRLLFSGDTLSLKDGEWVPAVLATSDPARYAESLELLRGLDFDVLVPWAATAGGPFLAPTGRDDAGRRLDRALERVATAR